MSKVKNISGGQLWVPLFGDVEDGEIVELPDFQAGHSPEDQKAEPALEVMPVVWPLNRWEPVTDKAAKAAKADTTPKAAE